MFDYKIELKLLFENENEANILYWAVKPDIKEVQRRSITRFKKKGKNIEIFIEAKDINALRASFDSIMSHLMLSKKIQDIFHSKEV
ncbi:MAG: KEOPS complex subunit Pcc1 [Candidatus Diapherotrites archaeon]